MSTWVKCSDGGYVNLDAAQFLAVTGTGSTWYIRVMDASGSVSRSLLPSYATEAEAQEALRKMLNGVEPTDLI